jgi:hypothetical protein
MAEPEPDRRHLWSEYDKNRLRRPEAQQKRTKSPIKQLPK